MNILAPPEPATARAPASVNGIVISRQAIAREAQHHPASSPGNAVRLATEALVIRELLIQEARRRAIVAAPATDVEGRCETREEASIRALIDRDVVVPQPTEAELRRYYQANRHRFKSPVVCEASHILVAARRDHPATHTAARERTQAILAEVVASPERFTELARIYSDCPSAADGGHLGQLLPGDTTPEFEAALAQLEEGKVTAEPVETRYGFHIIRLEHRAKGEMLPFVAVADGVAGHLVERSRRLASAQYVARLVSTAKIIGIKMAGTASLRVV